MKNEKLNKILDIVIKVVSIVTILAQTLKSAFPVESVTSSNLSQDEAHMIKDFLDSGVK